MSSVAPASASAGAASAAPGTTTATGTTTAATATGTTTTTQAAVPITTAATTTPSTLSTSTIRSSSAAAPSDASASSAQVEPSAETSGTSTSAPSATDAAAPAPAPIQSSKTNEHLARNICLGIFLLFAVVALIGIAYWGIPRLRQRWRERKHATGSSSSSRGRRSRRAPFTGDDAALSRGASNIATGPAGQQRRSAILMNQLNSSIVSFDSRSPAEKSKSTGASPASLAFSPPVSPKSPAPWANQSAATTTQCLVCGTEEPAVASASELVVEPVAEPAAAAAVAAAPRRPESRPPPLELEDVPRAVFYNHVCPSTTTIGSYPYEDEDSSHWAYVPPLSPFGNSRPTSPPITHIRDTARRDSDTYPRTPYM